MSFRCGFCRAAGKSGEIPHMHTTKTRPKNYPSGKTGSEIVEQVPLCKHCFDKVSPDVGFAMEVAR